MLSSRVLILIDFEFFYLVCKMELLSIYMVVLALMHSLHLSALVSLVYMAHCSCGRSRNS